METIIKCKTSQVGTHYFFMKYAGKEYYLFSQDYHRGVNIYFSKGVSLHNALDVSTAHNDHCVIKTMSKLTSYIKYIEREYDLKILDSTISKNVINKKKMYSRYSRECFAY